MRLVYNEIVMLDMIISSEVEVYVLACKDIQTQNVSNMIYKTKNDYTGEWV